MSGRRDEQSEEEMMPPDGPAPTWIEEQMQAAAQPKPMTEDEYGHMLTVVDEEELDGNTKVAGKDPLNSKKVLARIPPDAARYLGALRMCPATKMARDAAGVAAASVAYWRRTIKGFDALEREAVQDASEALFASCYNRAVHGVLKPVFQLGKLMGYEREYSDKLAEVLLKQMGPKMGEHLRPAVEKPAGPSINIAVMSPDQIGDVVRKLSPTSQPDQRVPLTIEAKAEVVPVVPRTESKPASDDLF